MNATIGEDSFGPWDFLGPNNDQRETNDNGTRLLSLSNENKLFLMNTLFPSKAIHRHTWYSPTGFSKRVDYILAEWHLKSFVQTVECTAKHLFPMKPITASSLCPAHFHRNENKSNFSRKLLNPLNPIKLFHHFIMMKKSASIFLIN